MKRISSISHNGTGVIRYFLSNIVWKLTFMKHPFNQNLLFLCLY